MIRPQNMTIQMVMLLHKNRTCLKLKNIRIIKFLMKLLVKCSSRLRSVIQQDRNSIIANKGTLRN